MFELFFFLNDHKLMLTSSDLSYLIFFFWKQAKNKICTQKICKKKCKHTIKYSVFFFVIFEIHLFVVYYNFLFLLSISFFLAALLLGIFFYHYQSRYMEKKLNKKKDLLKYFLYDNIVAWKNQLRLKFVVVIQYILLSIPYYIYI